MVGPYGLSNSIYTSANKISKLDTGNIITYATYIVLGMLTLIFITFGSLFLGELVVNPSLFILVFLYFTFLPVSAVKIFNKTPFSSNISNNKNFPKISVKNFSTNNNNNNNNNNKYNKYITKLLNLIRNKNFIVIPFLIVNLVNYFILDTGNF